MHCNVIFELKIYIGTHTKSILNYGFRGVVPIFSHFLCFFVEHQAYRICACGSDYFLIPGFILGTNIILGAVMRGLESSLLSKNTASYSSGFKKFVNSGNFDYGGP